MEKKTRFVRSQEAQADTVEESQKLAPYTNECRFSVKVGNKPETKILNGFSVVCFACYHWQPKNKPQLPLSAMVYDQELQKKALELKQGQSVVVCAKLGYDVHNGVAKLFLFIDQIQ